MSARRSDGGSRIARLYGASPWHLLALLACFALTAYAVSRVQEVPALIRIALWFVGAAVVWDLVLGPLVALADRGLRPLRTRPRRLSALNHVRIPLLTSALLLLVWAPVILQRSEGVFRIKAGLDQDPYLDRWVAITVALFALSALVYAVRWRRASTGAGTPTARSTARATEPSSPPSASHT